jgi:hypothetical protein
VKSDDFKHDSDYDDNKINVVKSNNLLQFTDNLDDKSPVVSIVTITPHSTCLTLKFTTENF